MSNPLQLANRLREVFLNGTFIANTNYKDQLTGTCWQLATQQSGSANSVAALVQHIHYYIGGVSRVFLGGALDIKDQYSFDFDPITSQAQWEEILSRFFADAAAFARLVEEFPAEKLADNFVDEKYGSYLRNIEAMIEHSYYHLGQVVLVKKIAAAVREI
jgi:hypothetical protein